MSRRQFQRTTRTLTKIRSAERLRSCRESDDATREAAKPLVALLDGGRVLAGRSYRLRPGSEGEEQRHKAQSKRRGNGKFTRILVLHQPNRRQSSQNAAQGCRYT